MDIIVKVVICYEITQ